MNTKVKILISFLFTIFFFFGCSNGSSGEGWEISGVDCCKTLNEFTITFNTRGGSTIEDMKVEKGTYVFAQDPFYELDDDLTEFTLPEPTKEGASFVGWIDLSGKAVFSKSSVYAEYKEYREDGSSGHGGSVSYYDGLVYYDSDTLELTAIWKSENPGTFIYADGGKYSNGKEFLIVEEDMNSDSDWTKIEEPVKEGYLVNYYFFNNIFSGVTGPFSRSNIYFSGDFKSSSNSVVGVDNFCNVSWSPKNTVSFETNGGSEIAPVDFTSNYNLLNSEIPTKDGYIFAGWYVDNELTTVVPLERSGDSYGRFVNNTCKVYAKWVASSYSVTQDNAVSVIQSFYKEFDSYFKGSSSYLQALDKDVNITIKGLLNEDTLSNVAKSISGKLLEFTENDETTGEFKKNYKPFVKVNLDISQVSGLTKIPDSCFYKASSITSIKIAEGVSEIGKSAFSGCSFLTNVSIPASVKTIGDSTFSGCSSLKEITIPEGVAVLGSSVFYGCSSLNSIVLPSSIIEIGSSSFENCTSLQKIELPKYLTEVSDGMFFGCTALSNVKLGDDITKIGSSVFSNCSSLAAIILPSKVDTIGSRAFSNCVKLSSIDIPANVDKISDYTFICCSSLVSVTLKDKIETIGEFAFAKCSSLKTVTLPNSTLEIKDSAFSECAGLTSITLGSNLKSIGKKAFSECAGLTSINLGSNLTSIGEKAFYNCGSLKEITLPETMESLGNEAFNSCSLLEKINIPGSVKTLPNHLFQNCIMLKSVTLNSGTEVISDRTFYDCKSLESISLPSTITHILQCAFYGCSKLSSITIPSSCKRIGDSVFVNCGALKSVAFASKDNWFITDNPKFVNGEVVDVSNDSTNANSFTGTNAKKFWYVSE